VSFAAVAWKSCRRKRGIKANKSTRDSEVVPKQGRRTPGRDSVAIAHGTPLRIKTRSLNPGNGQGNKGGIKALAGRDLVENSDGIL